MSTVTRQNERATRRDHPEQRLGNVLHVLPGTSSSPIAKFGYQQFFPLRWWSRSIVRTAVLELCSLPLRI